MEARWYLPNRDLAVKRGDFYIKKGVLKTPMVKQYLKWYGLKAELNNREFLGNFSEREIWWSCVGVNIGMEQDGKHGLFERLVLILRKFGMFTFLGIPLSTTCHSGSYYYPISVNNVDGALLLNQARVLSSQRLQRRMGRIIKSEFNSVSQAYISMVVPDVKKSDPQHAESPRAPSGEMYSNSTNLKHKSQERGSIDVRNFVSRSEV